MSFNVWQCYQVMKDHSKSQKCILNVLEFGLLHWLDIADCVTTLNFFDIRLFWVFCFDFSCFSFNFFCCLLLLQSLELLSNSDVELGGFHRYSSQRQLRLGLLLLVGWVVVSYHFSRITAPRIFLIFCMNVPYYKDKKRAQRFSREKSGSLIIHENGFGHIWPILSRLAGSFWLILHILIDRVDPQVLTAIKMLGRVINCA